MEFLRGSDDFWRCLNVGQRGFEKIKFITVIGFAVLFSHGIVKVRLSPSKKFFLFASMIALQK